MKLKYLATSLLIISLAVIGVFGFSLFEHAMMDGSNSDCVASIIDGTKCPTSIVGMALHHISAMRIPMTTMVPPISSSLLLLAFLFSIGLTSFSLYFFKPSQLSFYKYRLRNYFSPPQKQRFTRWLALHENSPTIL